MLEIEYKMLGAGWSECFIKSNDHSLKISASDLEDALGNLVYSACALLNGFNYVSLSFCEEPGEYRWNIRHIGYGKLSLRIIWFDKHYSYIPSDEEGERILEIETDLLEFGRAVHSAASKVLKEHGVDGYKKKWREFPFPKEQLSLLTNKIVDMENISWSFPRYHEAKPNN